MVFDPLTISLTLGGVFLIAFMKGGFGGGFAIVGIPLLALAMDPITAGALLAPLFVVMDLVALRFWKPATWSKPDLKMLLPGLIVGIAIGTVLLDRLDRHMVAIIMGLVTLAFTLMWFRGGAKASGGGRSTLGALAAGTGSGFTTMIAHAGGPPLAIYLLRAGLEKSVYAGTTSIFFTIGNLLKMLPWLWVADMSGDIWIMMALCLPVIPFGVWLGWRLHERLDQRQLFAWCYGLLALTALKLLWDGLSGL